ncbi:hypothetical protein OEZ85_004695 [Tetradesmus obliquus]|uniref:Uncharacterized protein n=1 Tax=Tetradesmus obliquus TaxID=3088 RepID=A0ABY8UP06_TETOB|nr:hypothetical protein OEZ85_004695 [Tetradesmus obliquus]
MRRQQLAAALRSSRDDRWPLWKKLVVGLCVGIGGGLIVILVLAGVWLCKRRRRIDKIRRHEAELVAGDHSREPYPDALATAGGAEEQGSSKQGKAADLRVTRKSTAYDTDAASSDQGRLQAAAAADAQQQRQEAADAACRRATAAGFNSRSSTFESAAAAGAAAAAELMDSSTPVVVNPSSSHAAHASPQATAAAAAVAAAAAAATARAAAAAHHQPPPADQDRAPWDDSFHLPPREPPVKRPPVAVEPWRPPKPSEPWQPTAPWRPPSLKYDIPALAPAEQFPRSVPLDESGAPLRMTPIRTSGGGHSRNSSSGNTPVSAGGTRSTAAAFAAAAAGSSAAAAAAGRHSRRGSAVDDYPATPTAAAAGSAAGDDIDAAGYQSGDEGGGFETPRSSVSYRSAQSNAASEGSFKSVRSNVQSESGSAVSFHSAQTFQSGHSSSRSFQSAASRLTSASGLSHSNSAREFPRAFVPPVEVEEELTTGSEGEPSPTRAGPTQQ